jgi:hypothetical protein
MPTGSIQFVSVAGPDSADEKRARQKQVRSHVTAQHYRQKRARDAVDYDSKRETSRFDTETGKAQPVSDGHGVLALRTFNDSPPVLSANSGQYLEDLNPRSYLGQGVSDPFVALPLSLDSRTAKHLYYC